MKKIGVLFLAALCLLLPAAGMSENLPKLWQAMEEGTQAGFADGVTEAISSMDKDLTLELLLSADRVEADEPILLTVRAGNPRTQETPVTITLNVPERIGLSDSAVFEAVLPAAEYDAQSGSIVPTVTEFTRELTLMPGGISAEIQLGAEMAMGTRFYRASAPLALCVADIRAEGAIVGAEDGMIRPGEGYAYQVKLTNDGLAAGEANIALLLPESIEPAGELPDGFAMEGRKLTGSVIVPAMDEAAGENEVTIAVQPKDDALTGDEDATKLLIGMLRVNDAYVPMPRIQLCDAKISAKLIACEEELWAGDEAEMSVVVVNKGLVDANVHISCALPEGLVLAEEQPEEEEKDEAKQPDGEAAEEEQDEAKNKPAAVMNPPDDLDAPDAVPTDEAVEQEAAAIAAGAKPAELKNSLIFDVHMDGAKQKGASFLPATQTIRFKVRAAEDVGDVRERIVGAALYWQVAGKEAQLAEPAILRISASTFLGLDSDQWSSVFWASLLLVVTIVVLSCAVHAEDEQEEYSLE